ncbi:amidohydrolase family protein [Thermophagus sp. OGC60D27]|uniref:amidohydrolase family protein n=1 Tax=Thermophagus sp. OGC60D27 TaxID=3458415 RepID=UPI0040377273
MSNFGSLDASEQQGKDILLKDFQPKSIYNVPRTKIERARFKVIDMHSHAYAASEEEIKNWIKTMDAMGIEKTVVLTMATGAEFDSLAAIYGKYGDWFELWCGFDYTGYDQPGYGPAAVKELERCYKMGARGVGELGDKGDGLIYSSPTRAIGMHLDDPRMKPLLEKCAELNMPISIHVADPYWMYLPVNERNDGLMNAAAWHIDVDKEGKLGHEELIQSFENAVRDNPKTTFIACHLANCSYNLEILGEMLDKYPNLYADIAARFAETATIPRYMKAFYEKYQDKLIYGTDMGMEADMYEITFRILETADEHFYYPTFNYHWSYSGFDLDDEVLRKVYHKNAEKLMNKN